MSDQVSIAKLISSIKSADSTKNSRLAIRLWLDESDTETGWPVAISNVAEFRLRESMFLKLPFGQFRYIDDGTSREDNVFYNGRTLYIGFEYSPSDQSLTEKNLSLGRYRIVGVKAQNNSKEVVEYLVTFIYDALGLVNSVPKFPQNRYDEDILSTDVMSSVCSSCGLRFSTNVETSDAMRWFNPSMNAYDFLKHVISHSYISEDDFGMFWVGKDGQAKFCGMRASIDNGTSFFFSDNVKNSLQDRTKHLIFSDLFMRDTERLSESDLENKYSTSTYILMTADQRNSDGWVSDFFGNSQEIVTIDLRADRDAVNSNENRVGDLLTTTISPMKINGGFSATDFIDSERVRSTSFTGYSSIDFTHAKWETAPFFNKLMRSVFFDNRHTILMNANKQLPLFGDQDLRIGDVLDIDFSSPRSDSVIDNGKYIVHTIDWRFQKGSDLYIELRVTSDSIHPTQTSVGSDFRK